MYRYLIVTALILILAWTSAAFAYPTSVNIIPTADVMSQNTLRLETELDGAAARLGDDLSYGFYAQIGLTPRFEAGIDVVGLNEDTEWLLNGKWQLLPEDDRHPALAIGLLNADPSDLLQSWYVVASRQVGEVRVHAGLLHDDATRGMFGAEYYWDDRTGVLADWTTGSYGYHTVGLWRDLGRSFAGTLYWAGNNTSADDDFVGLNLYTEFGW